MAHDKNPTLTKQNWTYWTGLHYVTPHRRMSLAAARSAVLIVIFDPLVATCNVLLQVATRASSGN